MNRLVLVSLFVLGCVAELPAPTTPLVATPAEARVEPPAAPGRLAPQLPEGRAYRIEGGASLWVVKAPSVETARVLLVSRRGEDGAHVRGLTELVASHLAKEASERVDGWWGGSANSHGTYVRVDVPHRKLQDALSAVRSVVTREPVDADELLKHRDDWIADWIEPASLQRVMLAGLGQLLEQDITVENAHHQRIRELRGYTPEAAEAVRAERFSPSDCVVIVVAPEEPAAVWAKFRNTFGDWTQEVPRRRGHPVMDRPLARAAVSEHAEGADFLQVMMVRRAPAVDAPDRAAFEVITQLAVGAFSSRLNASLRHQERLTYGAHGWVTDTSYGDVLYLTSEFAPDEARRGMRRFFEEMARLRSEPVEADELDAAVRRVWSHLRHTMQGTGVAWFLANAWSTGRAPADLLQGYLALENLTPAQLVDVARRTLPPEKGLVLVRGDLDDVGGMWIVRTPEGFQLRSSAD
ncbi:MAG: insulinase family protein [Sandaracinus sp.]|nr:insulinase family protein [Sandaracinus sp.]MCB9614207.1 insulinase family protein [Sandaracinus sp.]MCB9620100.1 insulinase family protein [Sandaracinus sp.]MCB9622528.1 insulinase family protein [Sandaracinus sp.]